MSCSPCYEDSKMGPYIFQFFPIVVLRQLARGHCTQKTDVFVEKMAQKIPKYHLKNLYPPVKIAKICWKSIQYTSLWAQKSKNVKTGSTWNVSFVPGQDFSAIQKLCAGISKFLIFQSFSGQNLTTFDNVNTSTDTEVLKKIKIFKIPHITFLLLQNLALISEPAF